MVMEKFTPAQIREICTTQVRKDVRFFAPFTFDAKEIVFKISYCHVRSAYVAEPGINTGLDWIGITLHAPSRMCHDIQEKIMENFGIQYVAGIKDTSRTSIFDILLQPTLVDETQKRP